MYKLSLSENRNRVVIFGSYLTLRDWGKFPYYCDPVERSLLCFKQTVWKGKAAVSGLNCRSAAECVIPEAEIWTVLIKMFLSSSFVSLWWGQSGDSSQQLQPHQHLGLCHPPPQCHTRRTFGTPGNFSWFSLWLSTWLHIFLYALYFQYDAVSETCKTCLIYLSSPIFWKENKSGTVGHGWCAIFA